MTKEQALAILARFAHMAINACFSSAPEIMGLVKQGNITGATTSSIFTYLADPRLPFSDLAFDALIVLREEARKLGEKREETKGVEASMMEWIMNGKIDRLKVLESYKKYLESEIKEVRKETGLPPAPERRKVDFLKVIENGIEDAPAPDSTEIPVKGPESN